MPHDDFMRRHFGFEIASYDFLSVEKPKQEVCSEESLMKMLDFEALVVESSKTRVPAHWSGDLASVQKEAGSPGEYPECAGTKQSS